MASDGMGLGRGYEKELGIRDIMRHGHGLVKFLGVLRLGCHFALGVAVMCATDTVLILGLVMTRTYLTHCAKPL